MSLALVAKVQDLERRLQALERERVATSAKRLAVLYTQAALMRVQGDELRSEVRAILAAHHGPRRLKAFAVRSLLKRDPLPSLRRVQAVIRQIRQTGGTAPNVGEHRETHVV